MRFFTFSFLCRLGLIAGSLWLTGFFIFVGTLDRAAPFPTVPSDPQSKLGIVALTGGGGTRIEAGLDLLKRGNGQRLLISGVFPSTNKAALIETLGLAESDDQHLFECCVDLGTMARTTKDNGSETYTWVRHQDFEGVYLVTTDYHLPRAKAHIKHLMPELKIIAVPVPSKAAPEKGWLTSPKALFVLATEYSKYIYVCVSQTLRLA